mmetsp:Transcript_98371/g.120492  ORF Transcript_98371/g.120492 Transcript_98371/m.120492 type:complete len:207 (-) Transcript_98371:229-849(-)
MAFVLAILFVLSVVCNGECAGSTATGITPFNLTEYLGVWYQIAVNEQFFNNQEKDYPDCIYANYSLNTPTQVKVDNTGYNANGQKDEAIGTATQNIPNTAEFTVKFPPAPVGGPYWIIKMILDANNQYSIALIWSCSDIGNINIVDDLWILSRTRTISDTDYNTMIDYAVSTGIDVDALDMLITNQSGCGPIGYKGKSYNSTKIHK